MASVHKELASVQAEINGINAAMLNAAKTPTGSGLNTRFLQDYAKEVQNVRTGLYNAIAAQGDFGIQSMKVASQTDRLTEMIQRQKFGLRDLISEHSNLKDVYKEQMSLQKSMVMQWSRNGNGTINADLITPRGLAEAGRGWDEISRKAGFYNQVLASVSDQTVKWGKNTQWAGRQLMAGISMPIAAAAAATGVLAYQVDKGLTQVVKVYGDAATAASTSDKQIRDSTTATGRAMAAAYGQSIQDSVEITSQLASTGEVGVELQKATEAVTRARTLGELNLQDAMKATITLQSVYNMNSQKLGETFDFMNSMENQTSLTMQDFVVGIPKVSGVLKEFGGDVQDAGILLAGMKAAGIDAAEGANAIKSIAFKVISPNQGSKDLFQQLTGQSFDKTMEGTDGVVERLTVLGKSIQSLSEEDRVGLIQKMFGLYQGSKTLSLLGQLTNESEQMTRAFEVAQGSTADWAATAGRELEKLQSSGWNRVKQQWELLKVELAEVGMTFLQMGTPILKFFNDILTAFNDLDPGIKKFILIGAVVTAALGPIIMLAGLFGNLIGNIGKLSTFIVGLALKFKILNPEQVIAARLAHQQTQIIHNEAQAFQILSHQIKEATTALSMLNATQANANVAGIGNAFDAQRTVVQSRTGATMARRPDGRLRPAGAKEKAAQFGRDWDEAHALNAAMPASKVVADNSARAERSWRNISTSSKMYAAAGVAGVASMVSPTGSVLSNIANTALIAGTLIPILGKVTFLSKAIQTVGFNSRVAGSLMSKSFAPAINNAKNLGSRFLAFLPALAPVGAALGAIGVAAAAAFYIVNKNIKKTREEAQQFADSAKTYGEVLGFSYKEAAERGEEAGEQTESLTTKVEKFQKANAGAAKEFQRMSESGASSQEKMDKAIQEGMKAMLHGASAEQGVEAASIALRAMGSTLSDSELTVRIKGEIDFSDMDAVISRQLGGITNTIDKAMKNEFHQGKSESLARWFTGNNDLNAASAEAVRAQAREMWNIFSTTSETEQNEVFEQMRLKTMAKEIEMFEKLRSAHSETFKKYNLKTANDLARFTAEGGILGGGIGGAPGLGLDAKEVNQWAIAMDAVKAIIEEFGKKAGLSEDKIKKMLDFSQIREGLPHLENAGAGLQSVAESQKQWDNFVKESTGSIVKWSDAEKLARLNLYRRRAGLEDAKSLEQGFGEAVKETTKALNAQGKALADRKAFAAAMATPTGLTGPGASTMEADQLTNTMRESYSGAMDTIYDEASRIMDDQNQAVLDGIERRGDAAKNALDKQQDDMQDRFERQGKAFEKRWQTTMDSFTSRWEARKESIKSTYDLQVERIEATIQAEQKAEDIRQKIFEAEKTRIQRLADMYNRNVDISMAINAGNLDEAAKLSNDATATQQGWLVDDASAASQTASDAETARLEKQKVGVEKARDVRLAALEKTEEAEKKALEARKEREKEAMDNVQKSESKKLEARKAAVEASVRAEADAARRRQEANKRALDIELAQLRAHIPQNEAQLSAHIARVQAAYKKYGADLQVKGTGWGNVVGNALSTAVRTATIKMSTEVAWSALGKIAADKMAEGAFNMNLSEFMKWITTGEVPKNYQVPAAKLTPKDVQAITGGNKKLMYDLRHQTFHSGGVIGKSEGSRTGFSGKGLSQSEVMINALKGEAVLNRNATRTLGTDFVDMANKGMIPKNIGGPDMMVSGIGGLMAAMMGGLVRRSMQNGIISAGIIRKQMESGAAGMDYSATTGKAGRYGGSTFNAEQLRNAGIIASTGKSMGASSRDIMIALMTAMQESTLRNLSWGDRDSVGLFQQRDAWGSFAERTNPAAATRMFFNGGAAGQRGLFDFPNRGSMTMGQAAQAVQVSAFPDAYDKWADEASAILSSLAFTSTGSTAGVAAAGGWVRPANGPRTSPFGWRTHPITGQRKLHAGSDIGAPMNAVIRAAKSGRVVSAGWNGGYGNYTIIDHGNGERTAYAHQSRFGIRAGQSVSAGQTIGYVGSTGASTGPHLHFEYMKNGQRVNPNQIIPGLKSGGFTLSDGLAQLHKKETVLTAPLSEKLKSGIDNLDKSQHFGYNVNMNFDGAVFNAEIDVQSAVEKALIKLENRKGNNRRIS